MGGTCCGTLLRPFVYTVDNPVPCFKAPNEGVTQLLLLWSPLFECCWSSDRVLLCVKAANEAAWPCGQQHF
jgi:hypothetical protein